LALIEGLSAQMRRWSIMAAHYRAGGLFSQSAFCKKNERLKYSYFKMKRTTSIIKKKKKRLKYSYFKMKRTTSIIKKKKKRLIHSNITRKR
jgi:hypothetical protein